MQGRLNFYSKYNLARHHVQIQSLLDLTQIPKIKSILNDSCYLSALYSNPQQPENIQILSARESTIKEETQQYGMQPLNRSYQSEEPSKQNFQQYFPENEPDQQRKQTEQGCDHRESNILHQNQNPFIDGNLEQKECDLDQASHNLSFQGEEQNQKPRQINIMAIQQPMKQLTQIYSEYDRPEQCGKIGQQISFEDMQEKIVVDISRSQSEIVSRNDIDCIPWQNQKIKFHDQQYETGQESNQLIDSQKKSEKDPIFIGETENQSDEAHESLNQQQSQDLLDRYISEDHQEPKDSASYQEGPEVEAKHDQISSKEQSYTENNAVSQNEEQSPQAYDHQQNQQIEDSQEKQPQANQYQEQESTPLKKDELDHHQTKEDDHANDDSPESNPMASGRQEDQQNIIQTHSIEENSIKESPVSHSPPQALQDQKVKFVEKEAVCIDSSPKSQPTQSIQDNQIDRTEDKSPAEKQIVPTENQPIQIEKPLEIKTNKQPGSFKEKMMRNKLNPRLTQSRFINESSAELPPKKINFKLVTKKLNNQLRSKSQSSNSRFSSRSNEKSISFTKKTTIKNKNILKSFFQEN